MDVDNCSQIQVIRDVNEDIVSILRRGTIEISDRKNLLEAIQQSKSLMYNIPLESLDEDLMVFLIPCIKKLLIEVHNENSRIDTREEVNELIKNVNMCITLTEFIGNIIELISSYQQNSNISLLKNTIIQIFECFHLTYKHCKESQVKYQNLTGEPKEILELYKKNQDFYIQFLNFLNNLDINGFPDVVEIFIPVMNSILNIIKIVFGINIKALADSWKSYCNILEKHFDILSSNNFNCVAEIECLTEHIQGFMNIALENNDEKQQLNSIKFSGFLTKVGVKLLTLFWEQFKFQYVHTMQEFLCSIYNYSLDFHGKWNLKIETQHCIQNYLFGVITPFVSENVLCENFLKIFLNQQMSDKKSSGCLLFDLKILKYLNTLPSNNFDDFSFARFLRHIFEDVHLYIPEFYAYKANSGNFLINNLCITISGCVILHSNFYDQEFEEILLENLLGNDIWCHFLASEIWTRIVSSGSTKLKQDFLLGFIELILDSNLDLTFNTHKIMKLKRFFEILFSLMSEYEVKYVLEKFPPQDYLQIWKLIGFKQINVNQKFFLQNLMDSFLTLDVAKIDSANEMIEILETMKVISTLDISLMNSEFMDKILQLWQYYWENCSSNNDFLKFYISKLCSATEAFIEYFSNDQIHIILGNMKSLLKSTFFKLRMCEILRTISLRPIEHNFSQTKLNSLISDIFEILLMENNETVRKISLETLQKFASNHIVVNNVSRMLPNMNLEQYLQNNFDDNLSDRLKALEVIPLEHKCKVQINERIESVEKKKSFEMENSRLPQEFSNKVEKSVLTSNFNRTSSNKRIKLIDGNENIEDDTISEVLERIKSEIKCLTKVMSKEKITLKNAQNIKLLASQLQNTLSQN